MCDERSDQSHDMLWVYDRYGELRNRAVRFAVIGFGGLLIFALWTRPFSTPAATHDGMVVPSLCCADASATSIAHKTQLDQRLRRIQAQFLNSPGGELGLEDEFIERQASAIRESDPLKDLALDLKHGRIGLMTLASITWGGETRAPGLSCTNEILNSSAFVYHYGDAFTQSQKEMYDAFLGYAREYNIALLSYAPKIKSACTILDNSHEHRP